MTVKIVDIKERIKLIKEQKYYNWYPQKLRVIRSTPTKTVKF